MEIFKGRFIHGVYGYLARGDLGNARDVGDLVYPSICFWRLELICPQGDCRVRHFKL
jgi:hypothetical protein